VEEYQDKYQILSNRAVWKVRGLAAVFRCYAEGAVTVMPSCGGGNIVMA